jgi:hypothetical protein
MSVSSYPNENSIFKLGKKEKNNKACAYLDSSITLAREL